MGEAASGPGVRLAELLAVLSLATDLGMGQPMEHVLRQCLISLRLAQRMGLGEADREVLVLRHFEQLTNGEAAEVLQLQPSAASKRYIRALRRLKGILHAMPGGMQEWQP